MKRFLALSAALLGLAFPTNASDTSINPLDDGGWLLVAHMSSTGGMFDGNGELAPTYSYGTFVPAPLPSTPDFQRVFPIEAGEILFITGDLTIWAIADHAAMRALIDALGGVIFSTNLAFEIGVNGVISNTQGNVLSRAVFSPFPEDPWISMDGNHIDGVANQRIVWGENNSPPPNHVALKNNHDGINVYVRAAVTGTCDGIDGFRNFVKDQDKTDFSPKSRRNRLARVLRAASRNCERADYRDVWALLNRAFLVSDGDTTPGKKDWLPDGSPPKADINGIAQALRDGYAAAFAPPLIVPAAAGATDVRQGIVDGTGPNDVFRKRERLRENLPF